MVVVTLPLVYAKVARRYYLSYRLKQLHFMSGLDRMKKDKGTVHHHCQYNEDHKEEDKWDSDDSIGKHDSLVREVALAAGGLPLDVLDDLLEYLIS